MKIMRLTPSKAANAFFGVKASSTGKARAVPPAVIRNLRRENSTITESSDSLRQIHSVAKAIAGRDADQELVHGHLRALEALPHRRDRAGVGLLLGVSHRVA